MKLKDVILFFTFDRKRVKEIDRRLAEIRGELGELIPAHQTAELEEQQSITSTIQSLLKESKSLRDERLVVCGDRGCTE